MINRVILVGRLTRDPELRKTASGLSVCSFSIAVDDFKRGQDGEKNTLFMNVSLFGVSAESVAKYCRKGSLVGVDGKLSQRKYTRKADNVQVTVIETIADRVDFLEPKGTTNAVDTGYIPDSNPNPYQSDNKKSADLDSIDVIDDDLPF